MVVGGRHEKTNIHSVSVSTNSSGPRRSCLQAIVPEGTQHRFGLSGAPRPTHSEVGAGYKVFGR